MNVLTLCNQYINICCIIFTASIPQYHQDISVKSLKTLRLVLFLFNIGTE